MAVVKMAVENTECVVRVEQRVNCSDEESGKRKGRSFGCHKVPTNWVRSERGELCRRLQDTAMLEFRLSLGKRLFGRTSNPLPTGTCCTKWPSCGVATESLKLSELNQ